MKQGPIHIMYFTGSGNTLLAVRAMKEVFEKAGRVVSLQAMEWMRPEEIPAEGVLGLAFPVACGSTYPLVWRFIEGLPEGDQREVFMLDTLAAASGGMVGPLRKLLVRKGYAPVGACEVKMPGNFLKIAPEEKNTAIRETGLKAAEAFARRLLSGDAEWGRVPVMSDMACALSRYLMSWWPTEFSQRFLRQVVNEEKCVRCGLCARLCPVSAITLDERGVPSFLPTCEYCQRCAAVCPQNAITSNGKEYVPYTAVGPEAFTLPVSPDACADQSEDAQPC